jgi:hypothetical protein
MWYYFSRGAQVWLASEQNIPCRLSILGCLCMEESAFTKLSIDRNPDSMSMYDTALKLKNSFSILSWAQN